MQNPCIVPFHALATQHLVRRHLAKSPRRAHFENMQTAQDVVPTVRNAETRHLSGFKLQHAPALHPDDCSCSAALSSLSEAVKLAPHGTTNGCMILFDEQALIG
jgi:hypothetical protein